MRLLKVNRAAAHTCKETPPTNKELKWYVKRRLYLLGIQRVHDINIVYYIVTQEGGFECLQLCCVLKKKNSAECAGLELLYYMPSYQVWFVHAPYINNLPNFQNSCDCRLPRQRYYNQLASFKEIYLFSKRKDIAFNTCCFWKCNVLNSGL